MIDCSKLCRRVTHGDHKSNLFFGALDCGHDCVAKVPLTEQLMLDLWTSLVYLLDPLGIPPASFHGPVVFASLQEQIGNLEVEVETE